MPKTWTPTKPPAVRTRSMPPRESMRKCISANGKLETPTTRAKRKRKAAQRKANASPKPVEASTTAPNPDPVQSIAQAHKQRLVPLPVKMQKQIAPKKAKVKGRWDTTEEIDDSSYFGDEVDKEKAESDDDKEDEGKRSAEDDNNMVVPHADLSDDDDSMDRMDQFVRGVEKTATEAAQCCAEKEFNHRAQEGAEDLPNDDDTTPTAKKLSSTHHVERDVCDDDEWNAPPRDEMW